MSRMLAALSHVAALADTKRWSRTAIPAIALLIAALTADSAFAGVAVRIDLSRQQMTVSVDGAHYATWAVSTARRGYRTPAGTYRPYALHRMHYSSLYNYSPMPYSIFFLGGYAVHGTSEVRSFGRPASHGCIRLMTGNARALFQLVQRHGMRNSTITIVR